MRKPTGQWHTISALITEFPISLRTLSTTWRKSLRSRMQPETVNLAGNADALLHAAWGNILP